MKKPILTLALFSTQAFAQPATPEQVASECITQMTMGICRTRQERSQIAPGETMLISGVGRVSYSAYFDYMDLYNEKNPSDPAMCKLALKKMKTQPGGDHDKIARALWSPQLDSPSTKNDLPWRELSAVAILPIAIALFLSKFISPKSQST